MDRPGQRQGNGFDRRSVEIDEAGVTGALEAELIGSSAGAGGVEKIDAGIDGRKRAPPWSHGR